MENNEENTEQIREQEKSFDINKISFEYFLNKKQYNRYLSVNNPTRLKEEKIYFDKIKKYEEDIKDILLNYLNDPKKEINNELNESLENFVKNSIKYLENKEFEQSTKYIFSENDNEDDEILFDEDKMDKEISADSLQKISQTFWGGKPLSNI